MLNQISVWLSSICPKHFELKKKEENLITFWGVIGILSENFLFHNSNTNQLMDGGPLYLLFSTKQEVEYDI